MGELEKAAKYVKSVVTGREGKDSHHGFGQKHCLNSRVAVVFRVKEEMAVTEMPDPFGFSAVF